MIFRVLVIISIFATAGCTNYKVREIDPSTGYYPAFTKVSREDIKVSIPFERINDVEFIYLRPYAYNNETEYEAFFRRTLRDMGFGKVINEAEFANLIISADLSNTILSITDIVSLNRAARIFGQFLIIETSIQPVGSSSHFHQELTVSDPVSGKKLFQIERKRHNFLDFDSEVAYPVQNTLKEWVDRSRNMFPEKSNDLNIDANTDINI